MSNWINLDLLANPINWIIVALVLIFGAYALMLIGQNSGIFFPSLRVVQTG